MESNYLPLELFHVLQVNKLSFSTEHNSWVGAVPDSSSFAKVTDADMVKYAAMFLSGISRQRTDTSQAKALLNQIQLWSVESGDRSVKVFNPDIGAFRTVPQSFLQTQKKS